MRAAGDEGILYVCSKAVCFLTTRPTVRLVGGVRLPRSR